jgi:hypothetical protein
MLVTLFTFDPQHLTCLSQFCDFDLCDKCLQPEVPSPPVPAVPSTPVAMLPSPRILLALVSPSRSTLVAHIQSPIINISSDDSPLPARIHPFFIRHVAQLSEETHEMRFHAVARESAPRASPLGRATGRATGRLRLRVSTPVFSPQVVHPASAPKRRHGRRFRSPPCLSPLQYEMAGLAMSTPPRVGFPNFQQRVLFPDSPLLSPIAVPSPIAVAAQSPASRREVQESCDAVVQTVWPHDVTTVAVQTDALPDAAAEPLTLQHFQNELQVLRNELRVLVMGFGF